MNRILVSVVIVFVLIIGGCSSGSDTEATDSTTTALSTPTTTEAPATTVVPETTSTSVATTTTAAVTTSTTLAPFEPTDPSVMVNDAWLAYECRGEGSPTVVVEMGAGGASERDPNWTAWSGTLDMIAETNKVCIYGRRGMVGSEPLPAEVPRTTQDSVDDLDGFIDGLDLETPVILVGYSLGGYNIRLFAGQHPDKVAGLVFVDATDPGMAEHDPIAASDIWPPEWLNFEASAVQVAAVTDLGDLPVYVLTATKEDPAYSTDPDRPDWWFEVQDNLLALSTNSIQTKLETTHKIIKWAEAQAVVDAIAWVVTQAR